eukprot:CAMPEP_0174360654 /NCGR_PEP_ID=MMETSP0811_2-20130205/55319_1 /TAXON_ID=73025 ORGANISM="Eutreptiella gymnastica-like, Strain CCMP1594" /NCGR_SAMPLE_ID=MMETSP0811_2 /ASSEMBLY_ACC=CAM_ASM_000667 /LENGTH=147 /DNA_ID=CAMNT_0015496601 /DNA_START=477 /DNA_END=920 /DNA_ORIENTATION=+
MWGGLLLGRSWGRHVARRFGVEVDLCMTARDQRCVATVILATVSNFEADEADDNHKMPANITAHETAPCHQQQCPPPHTTPSPPCAWRSGQVSQLLPYTSTLLQGSRAANSFGTLPHYEGVSVPLTPSVHCRTAARLVHKAREHSAI